MLCRYYSHLIFALIFFAAIAAVVFFGFPNVAQALTDPNSLRCCLIVTKKDGVETNRSCRAKGDQACAGLGQCQYGGGTAVIGGRMGGTSCIQTDETEVACIQYPSNDMCGGVLQSTLADCPSIPLVAQPNLPNVQCDKTPSCTVFNNRCYSVYDKNVCSEIRDPEICGKFQACRFENNKCVNLLQSAISSQYDLTEQGRGKFLEPCAIDGSCRNTNDILKLLLNVVDYAMKLIGVLAFVMFVAGGVTMITSFGKAEQFKKGQQMLVYAIIGIIVSVSAVLMVKFVLDAIGVESSFRVF